MGRSDQMTKDDLAALLHQVWRQGGRLYMNDEELRVTSRFPLPDDLMARLSTHKAEIISYLRSSGASHRASRSVYRFRTAASAPWQYLIAPASFSKHEAIRHVHDGFGPLTAFERASLRDTASNSASRGDPDHIREGTP